MTLRRRIEHSKLLAGVLAGLAGAYLRFCRATTRWQREGFDDLAADLAEGPVLVVMWHECSLMGPLLWPLERGPLSTLYASSPIGRVSGALQRQSGLRPMEMAEGASNLAASRIVLRRVREGSSIGIAADGPLGPARQVKDAPLDWARAMQRPVYGFAYRTSRGRKLKTWDQMWLPLPFARGRVVFARWEGAPGRRDDNAAWRDSLTGFLNDQRDQVARPI